MVLLSYDLESSKKRSVAGVRFYGALASVTSSRILCKTRVMGLPDAL